MSPDPSEHQPQCGHVLSARVDAILGTMRATLDFAVPLLDGEAGAPMAEALRADFALLHKALDDYWDVWGAPNVEQVVEGLEYVMRKGDG